MHRFASAFEKFVAPARARSELWRTILGFCLIIAIYAGLSLGALWIAGALWFDIDLDGEMPGNTVFLLYTFLAMAAGPIVVAVALHRRGPSTLLGRAPVVLRDFVLVVGLAAPVFALSIGLWSIWFDAVPGLPLRAWLGWLPLALVGLLIQTGAEELVFRGYLQQQLAARYARPLIWAAIPSLAFGLAHFDPGTTGANAWLFVAATAYVGLILADLTARTGSIGAAWGLHFVNNCVAILVISLAGPLSGLGLYQTPYGADAPLLRGLILADIVTVTLIWLILRRALQR